MTDACREIMVALPDSGGDVYAQHQQVWSVIGSAANRGTDFIYAMTSPRIATVRSARLSRGNVVIPRPGAMQVALVTARRRGTQIISSLSGDEAQSHLAQLLVDHGIRVHDSTVLAQYTATGRKAGKVSGGGHTIALPVTHLGFVAEIQHHAKAHLAWRDGIGRGKRFGFGMLRLA